MEAKHVDRPQGGVVAKLRPAVCVLLMPAFGSKVRCTVVRSTRQRQKGEE